MNFNRNYAFAAPTVLLLAAIAMLIAKEVSDSKSLKRNAKFTKGKVDRYLTYSRGGASLLYHLKLHDKSYNNERVFPLNLSDGEKLTGMHFIVVYDSTNPENNLLLLSKSEYSEYGIPEPDTLKWVDSLL